VGEAVSPYILTGPALISFSGGRTSGYMLHEILRAHGGRLPDDVVVAFANTGKEREETLRFVHECGGRWGVEINWLEYRSRSGPAEDRFEVVGYNSASRAGEPFEALIDSKRFAPNGVMRFCTEELKLKPIELFCRSLGWERWTNVVGLRHDEGHRCLKAYARNAENKERWTTCLPLDKARVTRRDVEAFWSAQPFDLELRHHEGNCDLCFLKGRDKLADLIRNGVDPTWWIEIEERHGRFRKDESYADLTRQVRAQPDLFDEPDVLDGVDEGCDLICGAAE
jgi:3'-phosphoadenosine 5'-phosphosulfate sulfotransferase (PAPS reductase)/FAD synthetase